MLHRGQYAVADDGTPNPAPPTRSFRERFRVQNLLQFDANFTFADKLVSGGIFWWSMFLLAVNLIVSVWNIAFYDWPVAWWSRYWLIAGVGIPFVIAIATLVWFGIGGIRDMFTFFAALRAQTRDLSDDGRVAAIGPPPSDAGKPTSHIIATPDAVRYPPGEDAVPATSR
jgi:SSS family solute:Na+ symporter